MVTKKSETSRRSILNAAAAEVLTSGAGGLRVDAVARAAGINKRMIYHYFGDREGLLQAVYAEQTHQLLGSAALRPASRELAALLLERYTPALDDADAQIDPRDAVRAAAILLPEMIRASGDAARFAAQTTPRQWQAFALDFMSLAFEELAAEVFDARPGDAEFHQVSKRLLTPKPRFRITPATRPA